MISEYFVKRFGLTKEGSDNLIKGIIYTTLLNISLMLPVGLYTLLLYIWYVDEAGRDLASVVPEHAVKQRVADECTCVLRYLTAYATCCQRIDYFSDG